MKRRETLTNLLVGSVGLVSLPAWASEWNLTLDGIGVFSAAEAETLTSVADTFIPFGGNVGALSVGVDKFLVKLISDCYPSDVQTNVKAQLEALDKWAFSSASKKFSELTQKEREGLLLKMESSGVNDQKEFFKFIKAETIRGFNTSREVMVGYQKYQMVPGHYKGCVTVES